jgi:hypothetical protein
VILY